MSDTIERLVRMLDEERARHEIAREHRRMADEATMRANAALADMQRRRDATGERAEQAEAKIAEWEAWGDRFAKAFPPKKGIAVPKMPEAYETEIPF